MYTDHVKINHVKITSAGGGGVMLQINHVRVKIFFKITQENRLIMYRSCENMSWKKKRLCKRSCEKLIMWGENLTHGKINKIYIYNNIIIS